MRSRNRLAAQTWHSTHHTAFLREGLQRAAGPPLRGLGKGDHDLEAWSASPHLGSSPQPGAQGPARGEDVSPVRICHHLPAQTTVSFVLGDKPLLSPHSSLTVCSGECVPLRFNLRLLTTHCRLRTG